MGDVVRNSCRTIWGFAECPMAFGESFGRGLLSDHLEDLDAAASWHKIESSFRALWMWVNLSQNDTYLRSGLLACTVWLPDDLRRL
jgi:hypothetical protein